MFTIVIKILITKAYCNIFKFLFVPSHSVHGTAAISAAMTFIVKYRTHLHCKPNSNPHRFTILYRQMYYSVYISKCLVVLL